MNVSSANAADGFSSTDALAATSAATHRRPGHEPIVHSRRLSALETLSQLAESGDLLDAGDAPTSGGSSAQLLNREEQWQPRIGVTTGASTSGAPPLTATQAQQRAAALPPLPTASSRVRKAGDSEQQRRPSHAPLRSDGEDSEVSELKHALQDARAYTRLLETRLVEVMPQHPLPVTEAHLGQPPTILSRLAATAAAALSMPPGGIAARASNILASTAASHRREHVDTADTIRRLEGALNEARGRLDDTQRRLREVRATLDARDREVAQLNRRVEVQQQRIASLEAERRTGGAGASAAAAQDSAASSPTAAESTTAATPRVRLQHEQQLAARVLQLEAELSQACAARDAADVALAAEARAGEESRAYIAVLERTVQNRLGDSGSGGETVGVDSDRGSLVAAVARLTAEAEALRRSHREREAALTTALAAARAAAAAAPAGSSGQQQQQRRPSTTGSQRPAAAAAADGDAVSRLRERCDALEAENGALVDYVSEARARAAERDAEVSRDAVAASVCMQHFCVRAIAPPATTASASCGSLLTCLPRRYDCADHAASKGGVGRRRLRPQVEHASCRGSGGGRGCNRRIPRGTGESE